MNTEKLSLWVWSLFMVIGLLCAVCLIIGLPVWILWNLVIPKLFGLPYISFWEAVGLNLLCSFLFKPLNIVSKK